jgi:hypothetical protein
MEEVRSTLVTKALEGESYYKKINREVIEKVYDIYCNICKVTLL